MIWWPPFPRWLKVEGRFSRGGIQLTATAGTIRKTAPVIQTMDKMETAVLLQRGLTCAAAPHRAHRNHRVRVALSFGLAPPTTRNES